VKRLRLRSGIYPADCLLTLPPDLQILYLNRLHRIQQITGRDLTDAAYHLDLGLALRAIRLFPPQSG